MSKDFFGEDSNSTNKAGYRANPVTCGWAGAQIEKVSREFGTEQ